MPARRTHYLDITGEIAVFEDIHSRGREIRDAGIITMPGVGFDVLELEGTVFSRVAT